jgi:hypothetical protein
MLMHRVSDSGSWDLLHADDAIVAVQYDGRDPETGRPVLGRRYYPTSAA